MYKLLAIDLDGTLLNSYGEVSTENKNAIKKAIENNIEIVLASGRAIMSVKNLASEIGCQKYVVCGNGAITYDIQNEESIYNRFLEKSKVLQIIKICEENSIYYNVYTEKTILTKTLNYNILYYNQENANKPEDKKTRITVVEDIYDYVLKQENENYLKITICDNSKIVFSNIFRKLSTVNNIDVLDVEHMSRKMIKDGTESLPLEYYYTEITNTNVDKWYAIEDLANKIGINKEEIVAIGDNVNDLTMIKYSGLGILMGNAAPHIKEQVDIIVSDNDSNGVAEAIEQYVIKE